MSTALPTELDAARIAASACREDVIACERFTTGLQHWVYDVRLESGRQIVVRIASNDNRAEIEGGVYWTDKLRAVGVPVADVLHHGERNGAEIFPYVVLTRLPGTDLGNCFDELAPSQLKSIAKSVATMQQRAAKMPAGNGYGYACHYDDVLAPSWSDVVVGEVDRAEQRIVGAGIVDQSLIEPVRTRVEQQQIDLASIAPQPFLHDATTKNVIVHEGRVSGLVDVDTMAFGDPLWAVALTRMSLLSARRPTDYIDWLMEALDHADETNLLGLYTKVFCLGFLGELGQLFNQTAAAPVDPDHQRHLESILASA